MNVLERSWYQRFGWTWLLLPLSLLFYLVSALRRWLFRLGIKQQQRLPVPVIVVGNISVGGTGKTPVTLELCRLLRQHGWKPGIISRGYGVKLQAPKLVHGDDVAANAGDEPLLLAQRSGCPVVIYPDRVKAGQYLLAQSDCNVIICDDGLQHYALARDFEIVLLDAQRGLGNGLLLPAGPLREGRWRLNKADLILANGAALAGVPQFFQLSAAPACALLDEQRLLATDAAVTLVSGIGNPQRFAATVAQAGYQITACRWFADHHPFVAADFADITGPVLMTEKDAVKCRPFARDDWYVLPVQTELPSEVEQLVLQRLAALRSTYGV